MSSHFNQVGHGGSPSSLPLEIHWVPGSRVLADMRRNAPLNGKRSGKLTFLQDLVRSKWKRSECHHQRFCRGLLTVFVFFAEPLSISL